MSELQAVGVAIASLKTAFDLSKAALETHGAVKLQGKILELQREILSAQQSAMSAQNAQTTLLGEISLLKAELARSKEWDAGKGAYKLEAVGTGAFAYVSQPEGDTAEPEHWLCVGCFDRRHKSLLQFGERVGGPRGERTRYNCPACKGAIVVPWSRSPGKTPAASKPPQEQPRAPGEACPSCGLYEYRVRSSVTSKGPFGRVGALDVTWACKGCEFSETKLVTP